MKGTAEKPPLFDAREQVVEDSSAGSLPPSSIMTPQAAAIPAIPHQPTTDSLATVIERLAANPGVDVAKLEKVIELQERILRINAEAAFNAAFALMQPDIPTIIERAHTDKTMYAPLEDIIEPLRPVLSRHGFSISHKTEWPSDKVVKVIGILTHREGHARTSEFQSVADQTGSKNSIQALGSTVTYGKRYTTKDLLCIVTREEDDDGERSEVVKPEPPAGYDDWLTDLQAVADEGTDALRKAWEKSRADYRNYLVQHFKGQWEGLKKKAAGVKA